MGAVIGQDDLGAGEEVGTVVVGNARSLEALNCEPYVNALAVQLSFILMIILSHCDGVPLGLLNSKAPACAVTMNTSQVSALRDVHVSVVYDVADTTRGCRNFIPITRL